MKIIARVLVVISLIAMAACTANVRVQPKVSLTPEQQFALLKVGAQSAASVLDVRITDLKKNPAANAARIRILEAVKGVLDEFNNQVADVTALDLSSREGVRTAIDKALAGVDHLAMTDVLQLNDPASQAYVNAGIAIVKSALKSFDVLFPASPKGTTE